MKDVPKSNTLKYAEQVNEFAAVNIVHYKNSLRRFVRDGDLTDETCIEDVLNMLDKAIDTLFDLADAMENAAEKG